MMKFVIDISEYHIQHIKEVHKDYDDCEIIKYVLKQVIKAKKVR